MRPSIAFCLVLAVAACSFPRPDRVGDDAGFGDAAGDSIADPDLTVHVANDGDDVNDGLSSPVRTLKRAIAITGTNTKLTSIALAAGRYSPASGETFPYVVPEGLTISGPPGGGVMLAGTGAQDGFTMTSGTLRDLQLDGFGTVITATSTASLSNLQVRNSKLTLRGETGSKLTVDDLDITGNTDLCGAGIELKGEASLIATNLTTRSLTTAINVKDMSVAVVTGANITGDARCPGQQIAVTTSKTFELRQGMVFGGGTGLYLGAGSATLVGTTFSNTTEAAVTGGGGTFDMTGGVLSNNERFALEGLSGQWSLTDVKIINNEVAVSVEGTTPQSKGILVMRGCTVSGNNYGVNLFDSAAGDLGTDANPGNNIIQGNFHVGLSIAGATPVEVDAVGNIWNPTTQGTNADGRYLPIATISMQVDFVAGNNYTIFDGWSLRR